MNVPTFSIIVPAYNAERYLDDCFKSMLNQDFDDYEVIVVDDGSKDRTGEICDRYAEKDKRIRVIHQENQGTSDARNAAIRAAKGNYVGFLDADDYYAPNALQRIHSCIQDNDFPDVFVGRFASFSEDTDFHVRDTEFEAREINGKSQAEVIRYLLSVSLIYTHCRFYVKRELFLSGNLEFVSNVRHEDEAWVPQLLSVANNFCALEEPFYIYRVHSNSFMTTADVKKVLDKLLVVSRFCDRQKTYAAEDVRWQLFEDRIQKLTLSAVSESSIYSWKQMGVIGVKCKELYRKHPTAFALLPKLVRLAKTLGWTTGVRFYLYRIKLSRR